MLTPSKKAILMQRLVAKARRRLDILAKAEGAADDLYAFMLKCQEEGLPYNEIGECVGLSRIRVAQVLREQRERAGV